MQRLTDPSRLSWTLAVLPLVGAYLYLVRRRALGFLETAVLLTVSSLALIGFGVASLRTYGWAVFVAIPLFIGLGAVLLYGRNVPARSFGQYFAVASLALALVGTGLLLLAMEGAICLLMAAPLAFLLALLGVSLGVALQTSFEDSLSTPAVFLLLLAAAPVLMGAEAATQRQAPVYAVRTALEVDAPPEVVWKNVVSFRELPPPEDWLFHTGIAYPVRAEIRGRGVGAVRYCEFSTGPFVEPVEVWDEPRRLAFRVTANPPSLQELSPYGTIHPPHVRGFLVSRHGQFLLTALPGGRTRLEGTTWYQHGLYPAGYWRLWSDWIIHRIHLRVLEHVKQLSEEGAGRLAL
jgi:hypothetical protein